MDRVLLTTYLPGMLFRTLSRVVHEDEKRATPTGKKSERTGSAWMRRHLEASIYLWACGEKADEEDEDLKVSDRLIGWLILFVSMISRGYES